jgi:hypothetical protein
MKRLTTTAEAVLAPGERLATTGAGWAAQPRARVPLLFLGRRQYWFALTDRRLLAFPRRRGGPRPEDLVLGKRYSFFALEEVHRHRPLFQLRLRGANDSRLVLEFRPGQRALAAELEARLTRDQTPGRLESATAGAPSEATDAAGADGAVEPAEPPVPPSDLTQPDATQPDATQPHAFGTPSADAGSDDLPPPPAPVELSVETDRDLPASFWDPH